MTTNTNTNTLDTAERDAIQALRLAYGRALDTRDWPLFASLFAERVDADFSAWGIEAGRLAPDDMVALMRPAFRDDTMRSLQVYTNFELAPQDGSANEVAMTSALVGHHQRPGTDGGDDFTLFARYHDVARRTPSGWKLASVRLEVLFVRGNPKVLA